MDGQQQEIKKAIEEIGQQLQMDPEELAKVNAELKADLQSVPNDLKKMTDSYFKDSASAKEAMGLTDAMVEGIYGQAYRLYNTGKYKEASQLFRLLMLLDAKQSKYVLGLAASFHMLKEFKNAIQIYTLCGVIDPESPLPAYHASDCYMQMKDRISAIIALEMAITRAEGKPEFQVLKDRAQLTIENLKKELQPKNL